jgi:hypothetical protein
MMNDSKQDATGSLDPEKFFKYARSFADRSETSGNGTAYPTYVSARSDSVSGNL